MIKVYEMSTTELHQEVQEIRQRFDYENLSFKEKKELKKRLKQLVKRPLKKHIFVNGERKMRMHFQKKFQKTIRSLLPISLRKKNKRFSLNLWTHIFLL